MLLALGDICFDNLTLGTLRVSKLEAADAAEKLRAAIKDEALTGLYKFGPVPDARRERIFREVLLVFAEVHGVSVPPRAFFTGTGEEGDPIFPVPANIMSMTSGRPILLVKYWFQMDEDVREAYRQEQEEKKAVANEDVEVQGGGSTEDDLAAGDPEDTRERFDRMFRMKVCRDNLEFYLIEQVTADT